MPKPPLNERIKALEDANALLIAKIDRMKAQVRHNRGQIEKLRKREDKQDVQELIDQVQAERLRRSEQSTRDKQRSREQRAAQYRASIDKRIEDCLRMEAAREKGREADIQWFAAAAVDMFCGAAPRVAKDTAAKDGRLL